MHLVDRRMDGEAGRVDAVFALAELVAVKIDLHQARRRDFLEHQPVRVDQEVMVGARQACRDMREDEIVPVEHRHQPIAGGEVDAELPFRVADRGTDVGRQVVHCASCGLLKDPGIPVIYRLVY